MGRDAASLWMLFHCHLGGLLSLGWILLLVPSARQQVAQEIGISTSYQLSYLLLISFSAALLWVSSLDSVPFRAASPSTSHPLSPCLGYNSFLAFLLPCCHPSPILCWHSLLLFFFFSSYFYKYCLFPLNMLLNILDVPQPPWIVWSIGMKWVSA